MSKSTLSRTGGRVGMHRCFHILACILDWFLAMWLPKLVSNTPCHSATLYWFPALITPDIEVPHEQSWTISLKLASSHCYICLYGLLGDGQLSGQTNQVRCRKLPSFQTGIQNPTAKRNSFLAQRTTQKGKIIDDKCCEERLAILFSQTKTKNAGMKRGNRWITNVESHPSCLS